MRYRFKRRYRYLWLVTSRLTKQVIARVARDQDGRYHLTRNSAGAIVSRKVVEFPNLDVGSTV